MGDDDALDSNEFQRLIWDAFDLQAEFDGSSDTLGYFIHSSSERAWV